MKKTLYIFLFFLCASIGWAQDTIPAEYPGGIPAMISFLKLNVEYPTSALRAGISGRCFMRFVVNETGEIDSVQVLKGVPNCSSCDEEAIRVVKAMPKWKPAMMNGKPIKTRFNLPIMFMTDGVNFGSGVSPDLEKYRKMANDYYNAGVKNVSNNELNLAVENFKNCLNITSRDIDALYNLGAVYMKLNEKEKACETWNKINALGKPDADDLIKQYCISSTGSSFAQDTTVYSMVEKQPEFPGGIPTMAKFISQNMMYPAMAREAGISGTCFTKFVVRATGEITNLGVMKGVPGCPDCDKEAIRVIKLMPKWKPGEMMGRAVNTYYTLPLSFKIQ